MSAAPIQRDVQATYAPVSGGGQVGAAIQGLAEQAGDFAVAHDQARQQHDLVKARLDATKQLDDLSDSFRADTDPDTMAARYDKQAADIGAAIGKGLDGNAATAFSGDFGVMQESRLHNIKDIAFGRQVDQANANLDDTIDTASRAAAYAANPAERASNIATVRKGIDGMTATGLLNPQAGEKRWQSFNERLALYDGKNAVYLNPAQAKKDLAKPDYLPFLDPLHRVELQNGADAELKSREREARMRQAQGRIDAELAAKDFQEVLASNLPVSQSVVDRAVSLARSSGDARSMTQVVGLLHAKGIADGLRGANGQEVDAALEGLSAKANAAGADVGLATAVTALRKFKENQTTALSHDPLLYGAQQGVVAVQPLKLNGQDTPADFKQRVQQARTVSRHYGVPFQPLTQAEASTVKTALDSQQDPNARLSVLQHLVGGFGRDVIPVLGKIGASDPALTNAGVLVASGPAYQSTARDVLTGAALLKDKANESLRPTAAAAGYAGAPAMMSAFAMLPDSRSPVIEGANAIYATRAARLGLRGADVAGSKGRGLYQQALQEAAGARIEADGTQYGGIGKYRGNYALVPSDIKADGFEDLVHHLRPEDLAKASVTGAPPAWEGGDAPNNLIHRTWLVSGGNGVYGLSATNPTLGEARPVLDKSGHPFRFRFGTALAVMQARTGAGR